MSGRSDLRMYVEHLFEGRTLDAETIELKEEIYGNLVARFDDYVGQGMSEDEAYRRTCDAVSSVEDVLGEKDEPSADATVVAPASATADEPEPPAPGAEPSSAGPHKRWPTWAIAVAAVAGVLVVGMIVVTVFNVVSMDAARDAYVDTEDSLVVSLDQPTGSTTGTGQQDGTGNRYGAPSQSGTGLLAEVQAQSADELAAYAGTSLADVTRVDELVRSLPAGAYVSGVSTEVDRNTLEINYSYQDRDSMAQDDDHVDLALVYDVVALMSTVDGLDAVRIVETEPDDGHSDTDVHIFDRSVVEGVLGLPLNAELLTKDTWNATRDTVMMERYWDPIWESADAD